MAETSQTPAANQRPTTPDTVYRVHVCLDGGPLTGLPLDTGFEENRSFENEAEAEAIAADIRANPMEYHADSLRDYEGGLKVEVNECTPLSSQEAR